jgi:hypothetical protein
MRLTILRSHALAELPELREGVDVAPLVIGVVAIIAARMTRDEIAHPLDTCGDESPEAAMAADAFSLQTDAAELSRSSTSELVAINA